MLNNSVQAMFDKATIMAFRAIAIEVVRRCDQTVHKSNNHTIPNKRELAEFRRWKENKEEFLERHKTPVLT